MPTYTIPNAVNTTGGADGFLQDLAVDIPSLFPLLFFMIFFVIATSGHAIHKKKGEGSDIFLWMAISGFITTSLMFILFLASRTGTIEGLLVNLTTLVISAGLTLIFFLIYWGRTTSE